MDTVDRQGAKLHLRNPDNYQKFKELDSMSLTDYCEQYAPGEVSMAVADRCVRAWLGVNPDEVSALFFIDYVRSGRGFAVMRSDVKNGGQYLRIRSGISPPSGAPDHSSCHIGTQSFSRCLAGTLPERSIVLSHPVSSIWQEASTCTVISSASSWSVKCRKVIVSVPTPLYRHINFTPPNPMEKTTVTSRTSLGYYAKTILIYDRPWWIDLGLSGVSNSVLGPVGFTRDTSSEADNQFSLTCFIVASLGRTWSSLDAAERQKNVVQQVATMFGQAATGGPASLPKPVQVLEQEWAKEEWIEGAPCPVMAKNALASGAAVSLLQPHMNVHFVGTETADVWRGYMEGAVRSGERGAREVIEALSEQVES